MKTLRIIAFTLLAGGSQIAVADRLSEDFKAAVESALKAPTAEERIERLLDTVESGTIEEIAIGVVGYFPHNILRTARNDNVCQRQTDKLLLVMREATEAGFDDYMQSNHEEYRGVLTEAITCVHLAYRDGIPIQP